VQPTLPEARTIPAVTILGLLRLPAKADRAARRVKRIRFWKNLTYSPGFFRS
jgi:hypothetical protein